jgi:hypothetical protein
MSAEFGQAPRQRALSASELDERCVGIAVYEELKLFLDPHCQPPPRAL